MAPKDPLKLTADQEAILKDFRNRVSDCLDEFERGEDQFLLAYLLNKKWKIDKAEKKLRGAIAWRREMHETLKDYVPPEVLACKKFAPYSLTPLLDKEGDPVYLIRTGCVDHKGIWKAAGKDNIFHFGFLEIEKNIAMIKEQAKAAGKKSIKASCIIDMDNFPMGAIKKPKYIHFAMELYNLAQKHFPTEENTSPFVKRIYIINNKPLYKAAIELAKSLTPDAAFQRVEIFGDKPEEWKPILLNIIPAEELPPHWGGSRPGPDEFCSDIICPGGKVPESMYLPKKK